MMISKIIINKIEWILCAMLIGVIIVLLSFFPDPFSKSLEIVITIISTFVIAMIIVRYTYHKTKKIERDEYFEQLYEEMDLIKTKIPLIPEKVNALRVKWKYYQKDQWIKPKDPVLSPYSSSTRFFDQYLPNTAFLSLSNRGFVRDIKGFNAKSEDSQYHIISLFYRRCKIASEFSQIIEERINMCIDNLPNDNQPSKFFKSQDLVFKWINLKTIQLADIHEIDVLGNSANLKEMLWEEFVDEKCDQIIKIFEDLRKGINPRISHYYRYLEFSDDTINDKRDFPSGPCQ